jgi:RNA polymerase sigma-70 factor (ECF subfamily)
VSIQVSIQEGAVPRDEHSDPGEEAALLRAGLGGDDTALEQLLARHRRPLVAFCLGILGHLEDAEDATQETFLRALRGLAGFRGDAAFRTWLFRIAVNVCLRWKATRLPTELWEERSLPTPDSESPELIALGHLRMMDALRSLLPRHRAVLLLKEWEGLSVEEIARVMRCSPIRVKHELLKARRALLEWRRRDAAEGEDR